MALIANVEFSSGNTGTSGAIDTTGATLLVMWCSWQQPQAITVSDSKSNTWTPRTQRTARNPYGQLFYAGDAGVLSVGSGHTFTVTGSGIFVGCCIAAFDATLTTGVYDIENTNNTSAGTSLNTGSVTPTNDNAVVIANAAHNGGGSVTIDGGFTIPGQVPTATGFASVMAYLIQTSKTAANPTFSSMSAAITTEITVFNGTGGGGASSWGAQLSHLHNRLVQEV